MHIVKDENGNALAHSHGKETEALLKYMLHHNEHHAEELEQMADDLQTLGLDAACRTLREAVSDFQEGNRKLSKALSMIQEVEPDVSGNRIQ